MREYDWEYVMLDYLLRVECCNSDGLDIGQVGDLLFCLISRALIWARTTVFWLCSIPRASGSCTRTKELPGEKSVLTSEWKTELVRCWSVKSKSPEHYEYTETSGADHTTPSERRVSNKIKILSLFWSNLPWMIVIIFCRLPLLFCLSRLCPLCQTAAGLAGGGRAGITGMLSLSPVSALSVSGCCWTSGRAGITGMTAPSAAGTGRIWTTTFIIRPRFSQSFSPSANTSVHHATPLPSSKLACHNSYTKKNRLIAQSSKLSYQNFAYATEF